MMKTKQLLFFCNLIASFLLLPSLAMATKGGKRDSTAMVAPEKRLLLVPQTHLQLRTEPIWGDSVEAIVTIAVPDSCKNQRYLCRVETNTPLRLVTIPNYKWAVSADSLKILSALPLQIRLARQNLGTAVSVIKIHFQNVDHAAKLTGTASLTILSEGLTSETFPPHINSILTAKSDVDSAKITTTAAVDSPATVSEPNAFGIFYVVLAIVLIFMFGAMSWVMKWSQRRQFQSIEAKVAALTHLQHTEPAAAPESHGPSPAAVENGAVTIPVASKNVAASSNLPAVIATEQQFDLALVLAQLQELKLNLQQILVNQREVNQRLAQITTATALEAPRASAQLALFDILNEDSTIRNGEGHVNGNGSSTRHFPTTTTAEPANFSNEIILPLRAEEGITVQPQSSSSLRIFFANAENKAETSEEILLH